MHTDTRKILIDVAMGRAGADIVIQHGIWVCVQSGEFVPDIDIAVKNGRIAYVGPDASYAIKEGTQVIDAGNKYLVPGLLDGHMHVESGMLTVSAFVEAVLPRGTTGMFIDPHEIANVFGVDGVQFIADDAARQPIHVWVEVPSCVPSAPGLETSGAAISAEDVARVLEWDHVIGLGEMMNYPGVAMGDASVLAKIDATYKAGKVIGGHYAAHELQKEFHAYVAGGAEDDHEGTRLEDAIARVRQGLKVMIRYGSAWQDLASQAVALKSLGLDARHFILCTDDSHAETLINEGHMDRVVRHAIAQGIPPMTVLQMATLNTAEHFGLAREIGQIAPGRWADILLVEDLKEFCPELVIARGQVAAKRGQLQIPSPGIIIPDWARNSVHIEKTLMPEDFQIPVPAQAAKVRVNVIGIIENQAPTKHLLFDLIPYGNQIKAEPALGLAKLALVERHHGSEMIQMGLVAGFGLQGHCAIASTVAHDCHHMLVVGTDDEDMAIAANLLVKVGGGQIVIKEKQVLGLVELPIGGIMSDQSAAKVALKARTILDGFKACGCNLNNPNMTMSLLALVVIPELRLSDKGLIDVINFKQIPLIEKLVNEDTNE